MSDSIYKDKDKIELRPGGDDVVVPPEVDDSADAAVIPSGNAEAAVSKTPSPVAQVPPVTSSNSNATAASAGAHAPQAVTRQDPDDLRDVITNPNAPEQEWVAACNELDKHEKKQARNKPGGSRRNMILGVMAAAVVGVMIHAAVFLHWNPFAPPPTNYAPYMTALQHEIKSHWHPPKSDTSSHIQVHFKVHKNGEISDIGFDRLTPAAEADAAALKSVIESMPALPPLPAGADDVVDVDFSFDYNVSNNDKSHKSGEWSKSTDANGLEKPAK